MINVLSAVTNKNLVDPDRFELEVRTQLPLGSPRSRVEEFLNQRGITFGYDDASGTMTGIVRRVKGSNVVVTKSLQLRFQFDIRSTLKSIQSKTLYTGP